MEKNNDRNNGLKQFQNKFIKNINLLNLTFE